jgi:hypothetical protein
MVPSTSRTGNSAIHSASSAKCRQTWLRFNAAKRTVETGEYVKAMSGTAQSSLQCRTHVTFHQLYLIEDAAVSNHRDVNFQRDAP